ncbi:MAG TPA: BatD family protein, partial [Solirubrobacterales bacterium]
VQGAAFGKLRLQPGFELDNFQVVGGPDQNEVIRLGAGRLARTVRISWRLQAITTGRAREEDLRLRVGGQVVSLGSREARVQEEPTGLPAPGGRPENPLDRIFGRWEPSWRERTWRRPDVFLRAEVRPLKPVVGEQVLYTVYLYTLADVAAVSPTRVPAFEGFWVRDIPQPTKLPTDLVEVEGRRYGRVVVLQKAIFPLRPGKHELEPSAFNLLVRRIERGFFGPPTSYPETLDLHTSSMPLEVQPLPPSPPGFSGAVGKMSLSATVEPSELRMGEAATLTLTLSGEGNLQGLPEPGMLAVEGLTVLPPEQNGEDRISGTVVSGSRTWSYAVVPERAGAYDLEVPGIHYYDPAEKKYKAATAEPIRLTALPAPVKQETVRKAPISPIPDAEAAPEPRWRAKLPWLLAIPGVLAIALLVARKRNGKGSDLHKMEEALREAERETRPRQAAARIEETWREHLAERWDIPPGTPSTRWADLLEERGADPEAARELVRLADDLHYLRYAPQLSTCDSLLREVTGRCRKLVRTL